MTETPEKVAGVEVGERRISIPGFTEEGENLAAETNSAADHTHGGLGESKKVTSGAGSRANRHIGFDVSGFPEPTGREEEWRFTPLKKLAGVLSDIATDGAGTDQEPVDYQVSGAVEGVEISTLALGQSLAVQSSSRPTAPQQWPIRTSMMLCTSRSPRALRSQNPFVLTSPAKPQESVPTVTWW